MGDDVSGFRLVTEIGKGAFARVYLAEELSLGRRLVALKISKAEGDEPRILAKLQHSHIVPVHSVHDDPATGWRLLCMPYFGGANLAELLRSAWGLPNAKATGRGLVLALDELSQRISTRASLEWTPSQLKSRRPRSKSEAEPASPSLSEPAVSPKSSMRLRLDAGSQSTGSIRSLVTRLIGTSRTTDPAPVEQDADGIPSRRFLLGADGIEAAVWIVARLAEGLDHAHTRGLLHRDLKPANILVASDGTPMLLDFNLSAEIEPEVEHEQGPRRAMLGGTLPYMSPEHLGAIDPTSDIDPLDVDERSDLYALGLILFEMIGGAHPFAEPAPELSPLDMIRQLREERMRRPVPSVRRLRPEATRSLDALIAKCLDPDPKCRYQSAHDLAEDLRRQLENLPMRHCPEPSVKERFRKWTRRHPALCGSSTIMAASIVLVGILATSIGRVYEGMLGLAARVQLQEFDRQAINTHFLLSVTNRDGEFLRRGMREARKLLGPLGLDEPSSMAGATAPLAMPAPSGDAKWVARLGPSESRRVWRQAVELAVLDARAEVAVAANGTRDDRQSALERAVRMLDRAESLDAAIPSVLYEDRGRWHAALGHADLARRDYEKARSLTPRSPQDLTLLATSLLSVGDLVNAEVLLRSALSKDPGSLWAWFALGHCHFEQERFLESAGDFSACVAIGPDYSWCHFNRALSLARAGRPFDALASYDRAIALDPSLVEARVNRALVELELDRKNEALVDLVAAIDAGCKTPGVLSAYGELLSRMGRRGEAEATFHKLVTSQPANPSILVARGMTRLDDDIDGARADFAEALRLDPRYALAHYGMALVARWDDHRLAISHLDEALAVDPNLADAVQLRALERARIGDRGALDDVERLVKGATAHRYYNGACAVAVYSDEAGDPLVVERAVQLLELALMAGFPAETAANDPDLETVRKTPRFAALMAQYAKSSRSSVR